jgi:hypothetical protein
MSTSNQLVESDDHGVEKYMEENLCDYQLKWLTWQSRALGYSRTSLFEAILSDWLSRRPSREPLPEEGIQVARQAMDEFIFRYPGPAISSAQK